MENEVGVTSSVKTLPKLAVDVPVSHRKTEPRRGDGFLETSSLTLVVSLGESWGCCVRVCWVFLSSIIGTPGTSPTYLRG